MNSIREWLEQQGLAEFAGVFDEERVEFETLPDLTETDLKDLGLPLGSRKKLLRAIRELADDSSAPTPFATAPSSSVETREAERRQLTVMFADLVGSTELSQRLDPEDLREINLAYQDAAKIAIESFGGFVARYMGDGVLAYFGYPLAHEDDAEQAVRSGLEVILAVQRLDTAVALAARVGVATGPVVVGDIIGEGASQESAVVGETPNLASRLQGLANPNELVISDHTRRLTRGAFVYGDLGEHALKGFAEPVQAWQVRGESISESRFEALSGETLGAFVGREHDLGTLGQRWRQALGGEGQAVLVSGEAGIGKSRVTDALRSGLAEANYVWIRHQCTPHHTNSALYPFISQLERASGATAGDADELRLQKLHALLAQANPEIVDEAVCLIAALLSISTIGHYPPLELSPQEQKTKTFEVLIDQFMRLAHERPMLWVFEDAQWADPTTRELLDHMVEQMHDLRALAVITARPEYQPDWIGLGHSSSLTLGRLSRTQSHALIADITSGKTLPDAVLEQIVGKTDGVPLFVEELTKAVLESALLTEHSDHYELSGPFQSVSIPGTLQDSLMSRLDRLGEAKQVAQTAAAIGREFQRDLLSRVMSQEAVSLERSLGDLVAAGMLFRRGVAPADRYVFKHALVQEAALDSMLRRIRQAVHKRIAEVLEAEFAGVRDSAPEVLAHHFAEAGEDELAIVYWQQAGRRSAQQSANVEAVAHLSKALQILATLTESPARNEQELALQTALGPVQMAVEGFASKAVEQAYTRARELCEITGQSDSLFQTLYGLFRLSLIRAQYGRACVLAKELLAHTERSNNRIHRLTAHRASGNAIIWAGEVAKAQEHLAQGISLYDRESDRGLALVYGDDPGVDCLAYSAMAQWWLGYADQARELRRQSLDLARELNHPFTLARALALSGLLNCYMRNFDGLAPEANELLALATQHNISNWQGVAQMYLGIGQASHKKAAADGALFDRGYANFRATGAIVITRLVPGFLADVLLRAGETTRGSAMLILALDSEDKMSFWDVELLRLRGDHELMKNSADAGIEAFYQQALSLSRERGARALELRTATSLARLWSQRSKRPQAIELLAPLYGWFTEGFDAPDLIEARQLLDELS